MHAHQSVKCLCLDKITHRDFSAPGSRAFFWVSLILGLLHECIWAFYWRFVFGTLAALRDSVDPATFKRLVIRRSSTSTPNLSRSALPLGPP
jgi:hypothetical protein